MNVDRRSQAFTVYTNSSFDENDYEDEDEYQECSWNFNVNEDISYGMRTNPLYDGYTWTPRNVNAYESYDEHSNTPRDVDEREDIHYYERSQGNSYMHPQWTSYQPEYDYQGEQFHDKSNKYRSQHEWQGSQYMHNERPSQEDSSLASMIAQLVVQQQKDHQLLMQKMDELQAHNEMLETQIAQQATSSEPDVNSSETINAITLRSGKELDEPQPKPRAKIQKHTSEVEEGTSSKAAKILKEPEVELERKIEQEILSYVPKVPFPQRLKKKMDVASPQRVPNILSDLEYEFLNQESSNISFASMMAVDEDEDENASKKAEVEAEESNLSSNFEGELHSKPNGNFIEPIIKTDTEYAKERFQKDEEGIESTLQENEPEEVPEDLTGLSASKASDDKINDLVSRDVYEESQQKDVDEPNVELQEEETSNNEVSNILCHSTSSETWPPYRCSENSFPKEVSDRGTKGSPEVLNSSDLEEQGASMLVVYNGMKCPKSHVMDQLIHISDSPYENCTDFSEPFDDSLSELDKGVQILESDSDTKEHRGILESADESFQVLLKEEAQYMDDSQSCRASFIGGLKRDNVNISTLVVHFKAIPNYTVRRPLMHRAPSKSKKLKVRRNDHGAKEGVSDRRSHKRRYNSDDDRMQREIALRRKLGQKENIRDQIEKRGDPSRSPFKDRREEGPSSSSTPLEKGSLHRTSQVCFF